MLEVAIAVQVVVQIGLPLLAGFFLVRRYGRPEVDHLRIFIGGAIGFIAAQAVFFGLTQLVTLLGLPSLPTTWERLALPLIYGITIGVLEQLACFAVLRLWLHDVRSWAEGLMVGVGRGGAGSVFAGIAALVWFMTMQSLRSSPPAGSEITETEKAHLDQILAAYWNTPWQAPLVSALQQVFTLGLAIGLASLVMHVLLTGKLIYLPVAMGVHAGATATTLYASDFSTAYGLFASAGFTAIGLIIAWKLATPVISGVETALPVTMDSVPKAKRKTPRPRKKRARRT